MKNNFGFIFIEVLIYLGLFGILFSGLFAAALAMVESAGANDARLMAQSEGEFLLAKIEQAAALDVFAIDGGVLKMSGTALNNSQTFVEGWAAEEMSGGRKAVRFILKVRSSSGKIYSQEFLTIWPNR